MGKIKQDRCRNERIGVGRKEVQFVEERSKTFRYQSITDNTI